MCGMLMWYAEKYCEKEQLLHQCSSQSLMHSHYFLEFTAKGFHPVSVQVSAKTMPANSENGGHTTKYEVTAFLLK